MDTFVGIDMNGQAFWLDYDGAEGIGIWVGDPENSVPLSLDTTDRLVQWVYDNFEPTNY